ncbi:MAG: hypothetical protein EPO51_02625 [Phenylobacterium sp.]|uniref:hypothetical protein n=1 Tax=Phenylobacterium sp. TaxID=1871053 RepID=UPI00120765AF|nr:hypothetical protein [Phenylobacterium sp.]TAJ74356.1 MAG: hypothetical protein EPO51_02625 [Phenylobacterium sp.]
MIGRTRVASPRIAGRRSRSLALALSALAHVMVLGWFGLKRAAEQPLAEAPTVNVEIVRLRPAPQATPANAPTASAGRSTPAPPDTAVEGRIASPSAAPVAGGGAGIDPRWAVDLNGPVFADGKWPRPQQRILARCDPLKDPKRESKACRREDDVANAVTRAYDPQKGTGEFAREGRHNEAVKRYRELPGGAGYPGIACHVFHRC